MEKFSQKYIKLAEFSTKNAHKNAYKIVFWAIFEENLKKFEKILKMGIDKNKDVYYNQSIRKQFLRNGGNYGNNHRIRKIK